MYAVVSWGGRHYPTRIHADHRQWILDAAGVGIGLVEDDKPAWPGAFGQPKSYAHKRDAINFCHKLQDMEETCQQCGRLISECDCDTPTYAPWLES